MHSSNGNTQQCFTNGTNCSQNTSDVKVDTLQEYWEVLMQNNHLSFILKYLCTLDMLRCSGVRILQTERPVQNYKTYNC